MSMETARPIGSGRPCWPSGSGRYLVIGAVGWGVVVPLLALYLPAVSTASANSQFTLVHAYGYWVLWPAIVPLAIAIAVGYLLRSGPHAIRRPALTGAWILSGGLLLGAVVGFVTFFLGIYVLPCGVMLVAATAGAMQGPRKPR
jgi:hypothetical protein